ncbi:MAG: hypothetical protein V3T72_11545 [Thermoanaerobaculia bacterium]
MGPKNRAPQEWRNIWRAGCSAGVLAALSWGAAFAEPAERPPIHTYTQTYGPYDLEADALQQMPAGLVPVKFDQAVWVVGYTTEITSSSELPSRDLHCHTMMMGWDEWTHMPATGQPFKGVFSDGFTPSLRFPEGYGIYFEAGEEIELMPMFNNRQPSGIAAEIAVSIDFIPAAEAPEGLQPLYSAVAAIDNSRMYMVPPGASTREREFQLPYHGEMHAIGVHIHPYGDKVEVLNLTRGTKVWTAVGKRDDDGRLLGMPFLSSTEGYRFGPEDRFVLRATYENSTDVEQDAMTGLFIFFSTEDGKMPVLQDHAPDPLETGHGETAAGDESGHRGHGQPED